MAPKKRKLEQQGTKSKRLEQAVAPVPAPSTNGTDESNESPVSPTVEGAAIQCEPHIQDDASMPEATAIEEDVPNIKETAFEEDVPIREETTEGLKLLPEESSGPSSIEQKSADTEPGSVGDGDEPDDIHALLEPLSKEQLLVLLGDAAEKHVDVLQAVRRVADSDPVHRKIFVHGLGFETDAEVLTSVFQQFGEIEDCKAVRDKSSGKSKGYAFILFKHRSGARNALKEPQKKIGNRMTACQLASIGPVPQPQQSAPVVSEYTQRKIYVSNVSAELDPQKLLQFFSKYGEIEEGPLGLDKQTGKPKGFTLFVYKKIESARKALEEPHKVLEGHTLHCQKAIDGPKPNKPGWNQWPQPNPSSARPGLSSSYAGGLVGNIPPPGPGHLMAPSQPAAPAINPALGQALNLLSNPAAGLGLTNLLGSLASPGLSGHVGNQAAPSMLTNGGYGNRPASIGSYVGQNAVQGAYGNIPGQGSGWGYRPGYKTHIGR